MTYFCSECVMSWFPYMTGKDGQCPGCGGGTKRQTTEPASLDAIDRYGEIVAQRRSAERHEKFEAYYAEREARRAAS